MGKQLYVETTSKTFEFPEDSRTFVNDGILYVTKYPNSGTPQQISFSLAQVVLWYVG